MIVKIEMVESEILRAIAEYISRTYGVTIEASQLNVEVKSKQNYKSEWEAASIRVNASVTAKDD